MFTMQRCGNLRVIMHPFSSASQRPILDAGITPSNNRPGSIHISEWVSCWKIVAVLIIIFAILFVTTPLNHKKSKYTYSRVMKEICLQLSFDSRNFQQPISI
jgi:hypothetical protein